MCKTCNALWNRDESSSRNFYKIEYNAMHGIGTPEDLNEFNLKFNFDNE